MLLYGLRVQHQGAAAARPHELSFLHARTVASDLLLDVWNGATDAARVFALDLDGKAYSGAVAAGGMLYGVTGAVAGVRRLDALAIGAAYQVLRVNAGATAPEWHTLTYADVGADPLGAAAAVTASSLGLVIGVNTQAYNAKLAAIAALASSAGYLKNDGAGSFSYATELAEPPLGDPADDGYILASTKLGVRSWVAGTGAVTTVAGRVGDVVLVKGDVGLGNVANVAQEPALGNPGGDAYYLVSTALGVRSWTAGASVVSSVAGRTGAVVLTAADIGAGTFPTGALVTQGTVSVGAGSTSNGLVVTTTGAIQQSLRYDGSNRLDAAVSSAGAVTLTAVGAGAALTLTMGASSFAFAVGSLTMPSGSLLLTAATATGGAGFRLPHGTVPNAPVNGDLWTTTVGLYFRINGVTIGPVAGGVTTVAGRSGAVTLTAADIGAGTFPSGNLVTQGTVSIGASATTNALVVTTTGAIQQSVRYDGSNRLDISVSSAGLATLTVVGASAQFKVLGGVIAAAAGLTVASGQTLTVTGATVTGLTAASVGAGTFPSGGFVFAGAVSGITTLATTGHLAVGTTAVNDIGIQMYGGLSGASDQSAVSLAPIFGSGATNSGTGVQIAPTLSAAAMTMGSLYGVRILNVALSGSALTVQYGLYVAALSGAGTNYAIYTNAGSVRFGGQVTMATIGAYVSNDKYLVVDASGNIHISATGPGS